MITIINMKRKFDSFTLEEALKIQEEHLQKWELILKPDVAAKLRAKVLATNVGVTRPYDICRGTAILDFVLNPQTHNLV